MRPGIDLSRHSSESIGGERVAQVRDAWGAAAHVRVALAPARLAPGRGQRTLIEAAAIIKGRGVDDIRFVIAGDAVKPAFARELDAVAAQRGVVARVVRTGVRLIGVRATLARQSWSFRRLTARA